MLGVAPNPADLLRAGLALPGAVLEDRSATMKALGEAAPDVLGRPLAGPIWLMNWIAQRDAAGRANALDSYPQVPMVPGNPATALGLAVPRYLYGVATGAHPPGTGRESPFTDVLNRRGWRQPLTETALSHLPDNLKGALDAASLVPGGAGVGLGLGDLRAAAAFASSPAGADVASSFVSGEGLNLAAKGAVRATAGLRKALGEYALQTSAGRRVAGQLTPFGGIRAEAAPANPGVWDPYLQGSRPERAQDALRQGVSSMVAERERLARASEDLATMGERTVTQGMQYPGPGTGIKNTVRRAFGKEPVNYGQSLPIGSTQLSIFEERELHDTLYRFERLWTELETNPDPALRAEFDRLAARIEELNAKQNQGVLASVNPNEFQARTTPLTPTERMKQLERYKEQAGQYPGEGIDALNLPPHDAETAKRLWAEGQDPVAFLSNLPYLGYRPEEIAAFLRRSMHGDNWQMGLAAMERDRVITPNERHFLEQATLRLDESMPAEKRMVGMLPEELNHQLEEAAGKATAAITNLKNAIRDLPPARRALTGPPEAAQHLLESDPIIAQLHETHPELARRALYGDVSSAELLRAVREIGLRQRYDEAIAAIREYEAAGSRGAPGSFRVLRNLRPLEHGEQVDEGALRSILEAERAIKDRAREVARFTPREQVPAAHRVRRSSPNAGYVTDTTLDPGRNVPVTTNTPGARAAMRRDLLIREPLKPMTEGIRSIGTQHAADVSRQRFINWVADAFGSPEGHPTTHVPLSQVPGLVGGLNPTHAEQLARTWIHKDVYDGVRRLFEVMDASSKPGMRAMIQRGLARTLQMEKRWLTASPRFILRNREAEWIYMMLDGTPPWRNVELVRKTLDPAFEHQSLPEDLIRAGGPQTFGELRQLGEQVGVGFDVSTMGSEIGVPSWGRVLPQVADEPTALGKARVLGRKALSPIRDTFKFHAAANIRGEASNRWNLWIDKFLRKGMEPMAARQDVGRVLFDYNREFYTPLENAGRDVITWYAWMRNNAMFAARLLFTKPGTLSAVGNVPRQWNLAQGYSPEEMQFMSRAFLTHYGLVLPDAMHQAEGTKRTMDLSMLSITDPADYMTAPDQKTGWEAWAEHLMLGAFNAIRPDAVAAAGWMFNVDPATGRSLAESNDRPASVGQLPTWVLWLHPDVRERLGIQVIDGVPIGPQRIAPALRLAGGAPGQVAGAFSENPRLQAQFVSWLTSLSIDPEAQYQENKTAIENRPLYELMGMKDKMRRDVMKTSRFEDRGVRRQAARADSTQGGMPPVRR